MEKKKSFISVLKDFNKSDIFNYLTNLYEEISNFKKDEIEYDIYLDQISEIIDYTQVNQNDVKDKTKNTTKKKKKDYKLSLNIYKLLSKNVICIFSFSNKKLYDFTTKYLNHIQINEKNEISEITELSIILLIDLFENFSNLLSSLYEYSINQIFKILKKKSDINIYLVYFLNSVTKNFKKLKIDLKLLNKLLKFISKTVNQLFILHDSDFSNKKNDEIVSSHIFLCRNYILCLKNLLLLSVSKNYSNLLASNSFYALKLKSDSIISEQHHYQSGLLIEYEKIFFIGLSNINVEIRIAMIELITMLLLNFLPYPEFDPIDYLINLYPFPLLSVWTTNSKNTIEMIDVVDQISSRKKNHADIDSILCNQHSKLNFQSSVVESLIFYVQMEQFQNLNFISKNVLRIFDLILNKFNKFCSITNHVSNLNWTNVLFHWDIFINFLLNQCGFACYESFVNYIQMKFNFIVEQEDNNDVKKKKSIQKSDNIKLKNKDVDQNSNPFFNFFHAHLLLNVVKLLIPFKFRFEFDSLSKNKLIDSEEEIDDHLHKIMPVDNTHIFNFFLKLINNKNFYIKNYAIEVFLYFVKLNKTEINIIISKIFTIIKELILKLEDSEFFFVTPIHHFENVCLQPTKLLLNLSSVLLFLFNQVKITSFQNSLIAKIVTFCTQNLKQNTSHNEVNHVKNSSCWIILSSLVNFYNVSELIKLNSSQFLVFWKTLLTSQFVTRTESTFDDKQKKNILNNLKLRNLSLLCLSNYLRNVDFSIDTFKKIHLLLIKSYNYLSQLEIKFSEINASTIFSSSKFDENRFEFINNYYFLDYAFDKAFSFEDNLKILVLLNKKYIFQCFVQLLMVYKFEIDSNIIIFLTMIFSDPSFFIKNTSNDSIKNVKSKNNNQKKCMNVNGLDFVNEKTCSYGITSKFQKYLFSINELFNEEFNYYNIDSHNALFNDNFLSNEKLTSESQSDNKFNNWTDYFEKMSSRIINESIVYDPFIYLFQSYSNYQNKPVPLLTSLVDISIELFYLVFSQLSSKIQYSLLEILKGSILNVENNKLRNKVLEINISITLNSLLDNVIKKKLSLSEDIIENIFEIIFKIDFQNHNQKLIFINSETIGLATRLLLKHKCNEKVITFVNFIANTFNPHKRCFYILILSQIYKNTQIGLTETYNIISQLYDDNNPIIYHYVLHATNILIENSSNNENSFTFLLEKIYNNYLNDDYGFEIKNKVLLNLKFKYDYTGLISLILKSFITLLGPNIKDYSPNSTSKIKNLIISLSLGIGLYTNNDYMMVFNNILKLFRELIIFNPNFIVLQINFFTDLLDFFISKSLIYGLTVTSPTSLNKDMVFPFNTSHSLYKYCYLCYLELIKVFGKSILKKEKINLFWISANFRPCLELKFFIKLWFESSINNDWFVILSSFLRNNGKKLIASFIENKTNYKFKLPLYEISNVKTKYDLEISSEEFENIMKIDEQNDDDEIFSFDFKLFIYDLLIILLNHAQNNDSIIENLKDKIQDIIKFSFLSSLSKFVDFKIKGLYLLEKCLDLFSNFVDPFYPGISILELQQTQIIRILNNAFNLETNSEILTVAINVCSKFVHITKIKFFHKKKILKLLIYLLEELGSEKLLKFKILEWMSEFEIKSIQMSVLNFWAFLKIKFYSSFNHDEEELNEILNKYANLLISSWILTLKQFFSIKYNIDFYNKSEIYNNYWITFIEILSLELKNNNALVHKILSKDVQNFFFVLFCQCFEFLVINKNVLVNLSTINKLVNNSELTDLIFNDEIFPEIINIFNKLSVTTLDPLVRIEMIQTVSTIYNIYICENPNDFEKNFDKLTDFLKITITVIFEILPFLKDDDTNPNYSDNVINPIQSSNNDNLLSHIKIAFDIIIDIINKHTEKTKLKLLSSILHIFAKIYKKKCDVIISVILPHLKIVIIELKKIEKDLIQEFYLAISDFYDINEFEPYTIYTTIIFMTIGCIKFPQESSLKLGKSIIKLFRVDENYIIGVQCINFLIDHSLKSENDLLVLKFILIDLLKSLHLPNDLNLNLEVSKLFDIIFLFVNLLTNKEKKIGFYSNIIPLLLQKNDTNDITDSFIHEKLFLICENDFDSFEYIIKNILSSSQKQKTENLMKMDINSPAKKNNKLDESQIILKKFL